MLKKSLSLVLMIALVLSILSGVFLTSYAATGNWLDGISSTTTTWDSSGTIGSASELAQFCYNVNHGKSYSGQTITLTADIDLSGKDWTPIGTTTNEFSGTFNGQGHTVGNMSITSYYTMNGLFGYIAGAAISNLSVSGSITVGGNGTGAIAALADGSPSTIQNCHSSVDINTSTGAVGGIIGYAASGMLSITNCCNTGNISSNNNAIGGICGSTRSVVTNCYNTGNISGNDHVGGIAGVAEDFGCTVLNCYSTGVVSGHSNVGGIVGLLNGAALSHCVAINQTITGASNYGRVVGTSGGTEKYAWDGMTLRDSLTLNGSTVTSSDPTSNNGADVTKTAVNLATSWSIWFDLSGDNTGIWDVADGQLPKLAGIDADDELTMPSYLMGSETNPYIIAAAADLNDLRLSVNGGTDYSGEYFKLSADIDLSGYADWTPIGNHTTLFKGNFDGDGHTISHLSINDSGSDYQALFGEVDDGSISNLTLDATCSVVGRDIVGGIAGQIVRATISNCHSAASVTGTNANIGGIAGKSYEGSSVTGCTNSGTITCTNISDAKIGGIVGYANAITISDCSNTGTITGAYNYTGGIAGMVEGAPNSITNSFNTGAVSGVHYYVGGIAGFVNDSSCTVGNCYNTGAVSVNGLFAGGIVGSLSAGKITNCYSTGTVTGTDENGYQYIGGISGYAAGEVSNCYNTGDLSATGSFVGGIVGYGIYSSSSIHNNVALNKNIDSVQATYYARVEGFNNGAIVSNNYAWDGMTLNDGAAIGNSQGALDGTDVTKSDVDTSGNWSTWFTDFSTYWEIPAGELPNLKVFASDTVAMPAYLTVSTDATLSGLTLSSGTLSPAFASGTTSYTASVAYAVTSITRHADLE